MEEFNNRQTPKLRFRQQQLNQPKAIEAPPPENKLISRLPSGSKNTIALPKLENRAATQSLVMKDIDREMSSLELSSKVRDLEMLMIDFKANIERRIQKTIEDNPQKFMQSFKQLEQQEMHLWKQLNDKQLIVQDQVSQLRNQGEKNRDALSQMILELQKKLGDQELKLSGLINQQEGIELKLNVQKPQQSQAPIQQDNLEVKLLREAFNNERTHRDAIVDDLQRQWQDVHQRLVKQESDFYNKLKQQREEFIDQNEKTKISIKALDNMKLAKINQDQDYIKTLIGSIENRIADEVERRLKSEFDQRNVLETKLQTFKEEIRNDEKQILLGEQKFMKQMHDSVQSLNQIIKNTKEQLEANLAASQTIVTENIKTISKTVEMIRETSLGKVALIEQGQKELNYRVGETRQMMHEHATLINNSLQKEFKKQQEQLEQYDQQMQKAVEMQNKILNDERQLNEDWKKQFSQKNLAIFTEVSANLKNIKSEQIKDKNESLEQLKKIQLELDSSNKKHQQFFMNLDQKITQGLHGQEFKLDQQRMEFQETIKNVQIQYNTVIHEQINFAIETSRKDAQQQVLEQSSIINERITREMEMADTQANAKLDHLQIQLKNLIREREEFILQKLQSMIDEEKELRQRLQELIEKYADMMRKFKEDLDFEIQTLKSDFDYKLNDAISKVERDYSEKIKDQDRLLRQEILNVDLKIQQQLDSLSVEIQKQLEQQKQYVKLIEKNIKSYVKQELDQTKHELKTMIKEIEDDLFKLRIWTLQQIEKMNQAMREIHIQIQSEMYMDRMYYITMQENFQDHIIIVLNKEKQDRLEWQFSMENQINQLDMSLNSRIESVQNTLNQQIETVQNQLQQQIETAQNQLQQQLETTQNQLQQQIDDANAEFKQTLEKLNQELSEKFQNMGQQFNEKIDKLHEQIKEDARILQEQINERFELLDQQFNQKMSQMQEDLENQINDLAQKLNQDLKDLFEELDEKLKKLRNDTQQGFTQSVELLLKNDNELKKQLDQSFAYFSSKFYLQEQIRQANEELDKERHTGIIGKLQLLVKEMERLEEKKNQIKKDLYDFIKGVQDNFNNMTEAIKAHTVFLNELDTKFTMEQLMQQTINEDQNYKLQVYLMSFQKNSEDRIQEIEEKLENLDTTVHNQMAQIQEDQDQVNTNLENDIKKAEKEIESHEEQLKIQEEQLKAQDEQLKLNLLQAQQIVGNIQLIKTMNGAMEINLSDYVKEQQKQTLDLIAKMNQTTLLNLQNMENNLKIVLEKQLNETQKGSSEKINLIMEDQKKVISDLILLKDEVDSQFDKVQEKFTKLQGETGAGQQQAEDLSQNMANYGVAIEGVQNDLKKEVARLQQQIDNLGQNVAIQKQGDSGNQKQQDTTKVKQLEERLNLFQDDLEKQFQDYDTQITNLRNQMKNQTIQSDKTPQNNANNNSQMQTQIEELGKEIDRLDGEINKLKKQLISQPAAKGGNQQQGSNNQIEEVERNMDELEKRLNQEMQKLKKQVEASELKGVTKDEFDDFQKQLDEEMTRIENLIETKGGKAGSTPTQKSDTSEIKAIKDEIAQIKKQLAAGGGGSGKANGTVEGRVSLVEKELVDINDQIKQILEDMDSLAQDVDNLKQQ